MKKTAFTLAEVLIVMAVMGFIAIIVLPNTRTLVPNESMTMFKKAYSVTGQIVNSLIEDEDLYPDKYDDSDNLISGFANTDAVTYKTEERGDSSKFCYLFAEMLNTMTDLTCDAGKKTFTVGNEPNGHFTTADGIVWILPITDFSNADTKYEIDIDINGENDPNCFAGDAGCNCESDTKNDDGSRLCKEPEPDRMRMFVTQDGKLSIPEDSIEEFYLKAEKASAKYHTRNSKQ